MPEAVSSREKQNGKAAIIKKVVARLSLIYRRVATFPFCCALAYCSWVIFSLLWKRAGDRSLSTVVHRLCVLASGSWWWWYVLLWDQSVFLFCIWDNTEGSALVLYLPGSAPVSYFQSTDIIPISCSLSAFNVCHSNLSYMSFSSVFFLPAKHLWFPPLNLWLCL